MSHCRDTALASGREKLPDGVSVQGQVQRTYTQRLSKGAMLMRQALWDRKAPLRRVVYKLRTPTLSVVCFCGKTRCKANGGS